MRDFSNYQNQISSNQRSARCLVSCLGLGSWVLGTRSWLSVLAGPSVLGVLGPDHRAWSSGLVLGPCLGPCPRALSSRLVLGPCPRALSSGLVLGPCPWALSSGLVFGPCPRALSSGLVLGLACPWALSSGLVFGGLGVANNGAKLKLLS